MYKIPAARLNNIDLAVDAQNENHIDNTVVAFDL